MRLSLISRFILPAALLLTIAADAQEQRTIPFGKGNRIIYDLHTGMYSVWANGREVFHDVFAAYEDQIPDTANMRRSLQVTPVNDRFGKGKKYTFRAGGTEHSFYTYKGLNGFYTETVASGGARSASPLTGSLSFKGKGVQVPFDNDAWIKYKLLDPDSAAFISSGVTAVFDPLTRNGWIIGAVEHNDWKTGIQLSGDNSIAVLAGWTDSTLTRDRLAHGLVTHGRSPRILVLFAEDWRAGMEQYARACRQAEPRYIFPWKAAKPFAWNSWGSIQTGLSLEKANRVADFFADSCRDFRSADGTLYIGMDSYWDNLTPGGMTGDFRQLDEFVAYCRARGLKAGIYWAPFVDWGKTPRTVEGSTYNYAETWTKVRGGYHDFDGARAMDPTHPATRARIAYLIKRFKDCGFEMIKIDFIGHAAIEADGFYDSAVTTGMQAFRQGMEFLTDQLDGKMLVYAAISPTLATARYVHMRRIACDAFKGIQETAYTLNSTSLGWWQNYLYDFADADHMVFAGETPGVNRARLVSAIVTGTLVTGDDFSKPSGANAVARSLLQQPDLLEAARNGGVFRPVDHQPGEAPAHIFASPHYLAILNYSKQERVFEVHADGLLKELFSGETLRASGNTRIKVGAEDAVLFRVSSR